MIHDPELEITCDGTDCDKSVFLPMTWNCSGYDLSDTAIERILDTDHGWLTVSDNHYCEDCKIDQN